jgi:hypothetical protein
VREFSLFHGSGDGLPQLFSFHGLHQVIHHTLAQHGGRHIGVGEPRQHDDRYAGIVGPEIGDGFDAVDLRHPNVADQNVQEQPVLSCVDGLDGFLAVLGFQHVVAGLLQGHADHLADVCFVVDDQHPPIRGCVTHEKSRCKFAHDILLSVGW